MAASNWGTDCRLEEWLFTGACEFDFFQAVRLLGLLQNERHGDTSAFSSDCVRFCAHNSLAFPASMIASLAYENGGPPRLTVNFLGLTGAEGALPAAYTEIAIDRESFGDDSFADFLDIFNHRLIQLFFDAWKKHHFFIGYEQVSGRESERDQFTACLYDLIGMGTTGLNGRMPVKDTGLLHYAGLLAQRPHSAEVLRSFLQDYFDVPVRVEQLLGKWHSLDKDELCRLGFEEPGNQLGVGAVAGDAVWSRQALVRIVLGPLDANQFRDFLPSGKGFEQAAALIRWCLGSTLEFEIQPTLRRDEVPPCWLGDTTLGKSQLGWSAWLRIEPFWFHATDAVFREEEQVRQEVQYGS